MFRPDGKGVKLDSSRIDEIETYLRTFESSHICHITDKTCYGGLVIQAEMMYRLGVIENNTVECLLNKAKKVLKL